MSSATDSRDEPLRSPIDSVPGWWGPETSEAEQAQLVAVECDLVQFAEQLGYDDETLLEFANSTTNWPRRRYLVCERLSLTRWAAVYVAIDWIASRPVVLKISQLAIEPEGRHAALVGHPNVVTVYDMFVCEGCPTMVLERCSQDNLKDYAYCSDEWPLVLERALEAGRGLAHCHALGLVHGDIKPVNILIADEVGKLADFGLARGETEDGHYGGTVGYSPPERDRGWWKFAGDVYSYAIMLAHVLKRFDVPEPLFAVLATATAEDPEQRPTMIELLADLERVRDEFLGEFERQFRAQERREREREREEFERERVEIDLQREREREEFERELVERERAQLERERARQEKEQVERDREFSAQRRQVRFQAAAAAMMSVLLTSTVVFAVCSMPSKVERTEPSIERAIELADAGDPVGAWLEYHRLDQDEDRTASPEELIRLADLLLASTSQLPKSDTTAATALAEIAAAQAYWIAKQRGDARGQCSVQAGEAARLRDAAQTVNRRTRN